MIFSHVQIFVWWRGQGQRGRERQISRIINSEQKKIINQYWEIGCLRLWEGIRGRVGYQQFEINIQTQKIDQNNFDCHYQLYSIECIGYGGIDFHQYLLRQLKSIFLQSDSLLTYISIHLLLHNQNPFKQLLYSLIPTSPNIHSPPYHQQSMIANNSPQCQAQSRFKRKPSKIFFRYKQKLIGQVIAILIVCVLAILERIFSRAIFEGEETMLANIQLSFNLQQQSTLNGTTIYLPTGITSSAVRAYSYTSLFKLQFLLLTHLFITLYVSVNAILASTLVYATMFVIYLTSVLQLLYEGPRPFWISDRVFAAGCMPGFNHPSRGTILLYFIVAYTYFLFFQRKSSKTSKPFQLRDYLIKLTIAFTLLLIQLIDYSLGLQHIVSIALGFIFFCMIYLSLRFLNSHFDSILRKSTVMSIDAKRYTFYWLLYLSLFQLLAFIIYSNLDGFAQTDWIKNFLACDSYQGLTPSNLKYDEIVGAWYVFLQTATVFGWIGAVFGIAYCFRVVPSLEWFRGTNKQRVLRAVIANLFVVPSWVFVTMVEGQQTDDSVARQLGINDFVMDSIHFFVLYLWLFGYMPVWVFGRLLKINNDDREDYYVREKDLMRINLIEEF